MMSRLEEATEPIHRQWMLKAIEEAKKAIPIPTAFCVGAVIVKGSQIMATGYSRELPGNTHAEECALQKLNPPGKAEGCAIYSTMEPCSKRLSSNRSCTSRIIEAGIDTVYLGVKEPDDFVICEGIAQLQDKAISVYLVPGLEKECLEIAKGINGSNAKSTLASSDIVSISIKSSSQMQAYISEVIDLLKQNKCVKLKSSSSSINKVISIAEIAKRSLKAEGVDLHQYNQLDDAGKGVTNTQVQAAIAKDSDQVVPRHEPLLHIYLSTSERPDLDKATTHQRTEY